MLKKFDIFGPEMGVVALWALGIGETAKSLVHDPTFLVNCYLEINFIIVSGAILVQNK